MGLKWIVEIIYFKRSLYHTKCVNYKAFGSNPRYEVDAKGSGSWSCHSLFIYLYIKFNTNLKRSNRRFCYDCDHQACKLKVYPHRYSSVSGDKNYDNCDDNFTQ